MPLPNITLDNRDYSNLFAELRRRIPAYTPEWTDYNESDPGIALLELFAWLADILVYRINQIPDQAYIKFLEMIGITLNLPAPAQAYLTFTLTSVNLPNPITVPGGTQVGVSNASSATTSTNPVIFATSDDLYVSGATLSAVQTFDGASYSVVNNFNPVDGSTYYAFSSMPQTNAALYMGFNQAYPSSGGYQYPLIILVSTPSVTGQAQGGQGSQNVSLPIIGILEYSTATGWGSMTVVSDGTNALTQSGTIMFEAPADWAAVQVGALRKSTDPAYYWMRYRISQVLGSGYQTPPQITNILVNSIQAINAVTVQGELIGASNGMPNQTFQISHYPVLPKDPSVAGIVQVNEGSAYVLWTEVPDFSNSSRTDTVYTLDYSTGIVGFGNGVNGKIPHWLSSDESNLETADEPNIQVTTYQWGGGSDGNVGANTITNLITTVPYVATVTNLLPAQLGADEETVEEAEGRAPEALRTQSRAVTLEDFEALAVLTPGAGIQRATAIPLQLPQTQVVRAADGTVITPPNAPGVVTVIVVANGPNPAMPVANDLTLAAVAAQLDKFRLVTCELYVTNPVYRLVEIQATVTVDPGAISGDVQTALEAALLAFYNPLTGGEQGTGWGFGETIYVSDAYQQILLVEGVERIEGAISIYVDGQLQPANQDIALQTFELVYSTNHALDVSYS
jgi:predicted phage baseplate assembly protein